MKKGKNDGMNKIIIKKTHTHLFTGTSKKRGKMKPESTHFG